MHFLYNIYNLTDELTMDLFSVSFGGFNITSFHKIRWVTISMCDLDLAT